MASLHEIHPVAGSVVDANLGYSVSDGPHVSEVAQGYSPDTAVDADPSLSVPKPPEPTGVNLGLAYLDHCRIVVHRILGIQGRRCCWGTCGSGRRALRTGVPRYPQSVPRLAIPRERRRAIVGVCSLRRVASGLLGRTGRRSGGWLRIRGRCSGRRASPGSMAGALGRASGRPR